MHETLENFMDSTSPSSDRLPGCAIETRGRSMLRPYIPSVNSAALMKSLASARTSKNSVLKEVVRRTVLRRTILRLLIERNSDVDDRVAEEIDEKRLSGHE